MSAPVQANTEYWEYYDLIRTTMPQNCSQDFVRIAQHDGDTLIAGDPVEVSHLKDMFGTGALEDDDFARSVYGTSSFSDLDMEWLADSIQGIGMGPR